MTTGVGVANRDRKEREPAEKNLITDTNLRFREGWPLTFLSRGKIVAAPSWIPGRPRWRHPALIRPWTPRFDGFLSSKLKSRQNWRRSYRPDTCPLAGSSWICYGISSAPLRYMHVVKVRLCLPFQSHLPGYTNGCIIQITRWLCSTDEANSAKTYLATFRFYVKWRKPGHSSIDVNALRATS